jgi:hypothetical protein
VDKVAVLTFAAVVESIERELETISMFERRQFIADLAIS